MNFDPILYGPLFVRDAPDVNLVASGADPVEVTVAAGGSSWTIPVTPVLKDGSYVAPLRMREILASVVDIPGLAAAGVREVPLVTLSSGSASMSLRAVYGSAAGRTPTQLAGHWLTWRDQISKTQTWGRERLTFLAGRDLLGWQSGSYTVRAKVFFESGDPETLTLASGTLQEGCRYVTVDASYAAIAAAVQSAGAITAWDVSYSFSGTDSGGDAATIDGYPLRLVLARRDVRVKEFIFCNSFGVEDRVYSSGRSNPKLEGVSVAFLSGGTESELRNDAEEGREVYSGHISSARDGALWTDFLKARDRHILLSGTLGQIVVDSNETDLQDNAIGSVKFTYHLAKLDAGRYFSDAEGLGDYDPGQRYGALYIGDEPASEDLPTEDLFFLKTRLDEFPAADLTEELLFLVQNPLTQAWGNAALSSLKDWLQETISAYETPVWNGPWADYSAGVAGYALSAALGKNLNDRIANISGSAHSHSNLSVLDGITREKVTHWDAAYGWGDHAQEGYLTDRGYIGSTHVQESAGAQALSGITDLIMSGTLKVVDAELVWNSTRSALHLNKPFLCDGDIVGFWDGSTPGGGGGGSLEDLSDTNIASPSAGQVLVYRGGYWVNEAIQAGVSSVALGSGSSNGTLRLTVNGAAGADVAVTGLGGLAYKSSLAAVDIPDLSATYLKLTGGAMTGALTIQNTASIGFGGVPSLSWGYDINANTEYGLVFRSKNTSATRICFSDAGVILAETAEIGRINIGNTNEINSVTPSGQSYAEDLYLNYRIAGNVLLAVGGGKVGIKESSPAYPLHVNGGTTHQIVGLETTNAECSIVYKGSGSYTWVAGLGCWSQSDNFVIGQGSTWRLKLDPSGNLTVPGDIIGFYQS